MMIQGPPPEDPAELDVPPELRGAVAVLRRGLRESPELRVGLGYTLAFAIIGAGGQLLVPILIQQILDRGFSGPHGFDPRFVYPACAAAAVAEVIVYLAARTSYARLVRAAENALLGLRMRVFAHIHALSIAEQTSRRKGTYVSRVTADMDTLSLFMEWGGISWITSVTLMTGTFAAMLAYSWRLALVVVIVVSPLVLILRRLQRGMLRAYDRVRTRVGEMLGEVSESLSGVSVVRAYRIEAHVDRRITNAIEERYRAQVAANWFSATIFPVGDFFGALAVAAVVAVEAVLGRGWGMTLGDAVAFLFLVSLFLSPVSEIAETFDQTQNAIAGWRKILAMLDLPIEISEPSPGRGLPDGPLQVALENVTFAYRDDGPVLMDLDVRIPAGAHYAVVGETGSGKTTFSKLLCRLMDATSGRVVIDGVDLREIAPASRRSAIRMIPQDGFLFDGTIAENVSFGRDGADDAEVKAAIAALGLDDWIRRLPGGLDTQVGERGENLSVGERQLVALARAQLGGGGLLILDEATSAVDPETERNLNQAMARLSEGRTTVTVAHRLSSAESADRVLVFDRGRIVEEGTHAELCARGGVYAGLYTSWLGNVGAQPQPREPVALNDPGPMPSPSGSR